MYCDIISQAFEMLCLEAKLELWFNFVNECAWQYCEAGVYGGRRFGWIFLPLSFVKKKRRKESQILHLN